MTCTLEFATRYPHGDVVVALFLLICRIAANHIVTDRQAIDIFQSLDELIWLELLKCCHQHGIRLAYPEQLQAFKKMYGIPVPSAILLPPFVIRFRQGGVYRRSLQQ